MRAAAIAAAVAVAGASATARAHDFQCTKDVGWVLTGEDGAPVTGEDGLPVFDGPGPVGLLTVDVYPTTVAFQVGVTNKATEPSTVSGILDPLEQWAGSSWSFGSALEPGDVFSAGESRTFATALRLDSYEACLALAAQVSGEAPVCGGTVPNRFGLAYETGYAECRAELVCLPASAPVPAWEGVKQLGSVGAELLTELVTTPDGRVHGVGWTGGSGEPGAPGLFGPVTGGFDAFHLAFDASGQLVLGNQIAPFESFRALAFDGAGNTVVAGHLDSSGLHLPADEAVAKLSPADEVFWTVLPGAWVSDVGVDAAGGIYVTGTTAGPILGTTPPAERTAYLLKLTSGGDVDWLEFLGGTDGAALAVTPSGAGWVVGPAFVAHFDADGIVLPAATPPFDAAHVALAPDGGAWVAGPSGTGTGTGVSRYAPSGALSWTRHVASEAYSTRPGALAAHPAGGVWVAGSIFGTLPGHVSAGAEDAFVAGFTAGGDLAFATQLGTSYDDAARALAIDRLGNGYVGGWTDFGAFPGYVSAGDFDVFVAKVSPQGVIQ